MKYKNLIFDWSGTLVNDFPPTLEATNVVLRHYGQSSMDDAEFRERFRLPYTDFYQEVLPQVALAELEDVFRMAFRASKHVVDVLPHAREMLEWGRSLGCRFFVLSSMDAGVFQEQAERLELAGFFEDIHAGVIDKRLRISLIMEKHRLVHAETAFVGDMVHDIETAHHGGVSSVAVLTGYDPRPRLEAAKPTLLLEDLSHFRLWLEKNREQTILER